MPDSVSFMAINENNRVLLFSCFRHHPDSTIQDNGGWTTNTVHPSNPIGLVGRIVSKHNPGIQSGNTIVSVISQGSITSRTENSTTSQQSCSCQRRRLDQITIIIIIIVVVVGLQTTFIVTKHHSRLVHSNYCTPAGPTHGGRHRGEGHVYD